MKAVELLDSLGYVKGEYLISAERLRNGELKKHVMPRKKALLLAAAIAAALLLVGCAVAYALNLKNMKIGERTYKEEERYGVNWEKIPARTETREFISLQGFSDSPNLRAAREWMEYTQALPQDGDMEAGISDTYCYTYGCQTQEMVEKLDSILKKYRLEPLGHRFSPSVSQYDLELEALGLTGLCQEGVEAKYTAGNFYPEGTFEMTVTLRLPEMWYYDIRTDFSYSRKAYFDNSYLNLESLDSYRQWEYELPSGGKALLATNDAHGLILVDQGDAFISVYFDTKTGMDVMHQETIEAVADCFDFTLRPKVLTEEESIAYQEKLGELEALEDMVSRRLLEEYEAAAKKTDYSQWVREITETSSDISGMGYALLDITGDGKEELLIGMDGYCAGIYWEKNGMVEQLSNAARYLYPCQGGKLVTSRGLGEDEDFTILDITGEHPQGEARIRYLPGNPEGQWQKYSTEDWDSKEPISKEEYDRILNSYVRIPVQFLPLLDYPMDPPLVPAKPKDGYQDPYHTYEELVRMKLTNLEEHWPRWSFQLLDLNGDRQEEMIWREDSRIHVYTIRGNGIYRYSTYPADSFTVCENGVLETVASYGPVNKAYRYYRMDGDRLTLVDYLRYDVDADPENPWLRSPDLSCQDTTLEKITQAEADAIRAGYLPIALNLKPITEYPFS